MKKDLQTCSILTTKNNLQLNFLLCSVTIAYINPTNIKREPGSDGGDADLPFFTEEGSTKSLGGTHPAQEQVIIGNSRHSGILSKKITPYIQCKGYYFIQLLIKGGNQLCRCSENKSCIHGCDISVLINVATGKHKLVLNRMVKAAGVTVLFNTTVTEAVTENGAISSVKTLAMGRNYEFFADYFIDATGDAILSVLAGCEFKLGREKDNLCQPMTLCFRMGGIDKDKFWEVKPRINEVYREFKKKGLIKNPRENVLTFDNANEGMIHFNTTRIAMKNPTDIFDLTEAEFEAREQVFEVLEFLRNNIEGFEKARVTSTAMQIGIRESRKVVGEYTITKEDLISLRRFDDAIATANYAIDIHNPEGTGTECRFFDEGTWYQIPYRCLIPKSMKNMLVVGKCISATHEAHSSYRIMPYCAELGQAAGAAISIAKSDNVPDVRNIDIKKLQEILRREGIDI